MESLDLSHNNTVYVGCIRIGTICFLFFFFWLIWAGGVGLPVWRLPDGSFPSQLSCLALRTPTLRSGCFSDNVGFSRPSNASCSHFAYGNWSLWMSQGQASQQQLRGPFRLVSSSYRTISTYLNGGFHINCG